MITILLIFVAHTNSCIIFSSIQPYRRTVSIITINITPIAYHHGLEIFNELLLAIKTIQIPKIALIVVVEDIWLAIYKEPPCQRANNKPKIMCFFILEINYIHEEIFSFIIFLISCLLYNWLHNGEWWKRHSFWTFIVSMRIHTIVLLTIAAWGILFFCFFILVKEEGKGSNSESLYVTFGEWKQTNQ